MTIKTIKRPNGWILCYEQTYLGQPIAHGIEGRRYWYCNADLWKHGIDPRQQDPAGVRRYKTPEYPFPVTLSCEEWLYREITPSRVLSQGRRR